MEQVADAEQLDNHGPFGMTFAARREPAAIGEILADRHVREQSRVLEHVADASPVFRHVDAFCGIDKHAAVGGDAAAIRPDQSGDDVDQRRLAGPGGAEQRGEPPAAFECGVELERTQPMPHVDRQRHSRSMPRPTRRASASEAISATIETAIEIVIRRSTPASPPGTWVKV